LHPVIASKTFACFLCVSQRYFLLIGILYNFVFFGYRDFHGILEFKIKHVDYYYGYYGFQVFLRVTLPPLKTGNSATSPRHKFSR